MTREEFFKAWDPYQDIQCLDSDGMRKQKIEFMNDLNAVIRSHDGTVEQDEVFRCSHPEFHLAKKLKKNNFWYRKCKRCGFEQVSEEFTTTKHPVWS